jgi:hypothetical protein
MNDNQDLQDLLSDLSALGFKPDLEFTLSKIEGFTSSGLATILLKKSREIKTEYFVDESCNIVNLCVYVKSSASQLTVDGIHGVCISWNWIDLKIINITHVYNRKKYEWALDLSEEMQWIMDDIFEHDESKATIPGFPGVVATDMLKPGYPHVHTNVLLCYWAHLISNIIYRTFDIEEIWCGKKDKNFKRI